MPIADVGAGQTVHGFLIRAVTPLPELRAVAVEAEHAVSGLRLVHVAAEDPENLFAIGFRTPPPDNTGLPHILEHTVLCGSDRYPVKDPFVELLKTSLATFLNAMTYPDRTVYPCASMNHRDFFNLASVYCDAVFHPRISEDHFKQEGHHFEFAEPGNTASPLTIRGIVYNEMKGAYSTLEGLIHRNSEGLFPDCAYGLDSGGSPDDIPKLTYAQFRAFHARCYHPSNAFLFLYGDVPTTRHLAFLDGTALRGFGRIEIDTAIAPQPRWDRPRRIAVPYPAAPDETPQRKSAFVLAWMANRITDPFETMAMAILSQYLLGHEGSPLRKALIDAQLGEDLVFEGYSAWRREAVFGCGLKGIDVARAPDVEKLILDTLRGIVARGLEPGPLESCFHQFELSTREMPSQYPLVLMDRVFNSWFHGADPLSLLRAREQLSELRKRHEADPGYLRGILDRWVPSNPHCLAMTFTPDPALNARKEREFASRMAGVKAGLSPADLDRIAREAAALQRMQEAPNTPEALATLPRLHRDDVAPEPPPLQVAAGEAAGRPLLRAEVFANGLSYLNLAVDLRGLDEDLYDYLPLYAEAMTQMGAGGLDYAAMAEREASLTGGLDASVGAAGRVDDPDFVRPCLHLTIHALDEKAGGMMDVLRERLLENDLEDLARLADVIVQSHVGRRDAVVPSGSQYAAGFAMRGFSRNADLAERFGGVSQVRFMKRMAETAGREPAAVASRLARIREFLRNRARYHAAVVAADGPFGVIRGRLDAMLQGLPAAPVPEAGRAWIRRPAAWDGIAAPAEVAFVARACPAVATVHPLAPALMLLATHLGLDFLWTEVRVKNGAYGCHARYNQGLGLFAMSSYRDPSVGATLAVYDRVVAHVLDGGMDLSEGALEQQIIGAIKMLDPPIRPAGVVTTALARHLSGSTVETRRAFRRGLLGVTAEDVRRIASEVLAPGLKDAPVCVIAGREKLEAARPSLARPLTIEEL